MGGTEKARQEKIADRKMGGEEGTIGNRVPISM